MTITRTELDQAKELCDLGICVSRGEARRFIAAGAYQKLKDRHVASKFSNKAHVTLTFEVPCLARNGELVFPIEEKDMIEYLERKDISGDLKFDFDFPIKIVGVYSVESEDEYIKIWVVKGEKSIEKPEPSVIDLRVKLNQFLNSKIKRGGFYDTTIEDPEFLNGLTKMIVEHYQGV